MRTDSPLLLVVSGLPASGKTFLGTHLAHALRLPLVTRDEYKEILYRHLPDLTHAQAGPVGFSLMRQVAGVILAAGSSVVLESHFYRPISEGHIRELATTHRARLAQVLRGDAAGTQAASCAAGGLQEAAPHRPAVRHEELPAEACWHPLDLGAPLLRVDTTHPEARGVALARAHQHIGGSPHAQQEEETP